MASSPFETPLTTNKLAHQRGFDGDQEVISQDQSPLREGSHSMLTTGGANNIWTICGNQPAMKYWCHNAALDGNGNFQGRDEADGGGLMALCEDNTLRFFGAVTGVRRSALAWTQSFGIDSLTPYTSVARSGCIGEFLTATANANTVALTSGTAATITSVTLSGGDWEVFGVVNYTPANTTSITRLAHGANTTAATLGAQNSFAEDITPAQVPGNTIFTKNAPTIRVTVAAGATQIVYLVARATFTASTLTAGGNINARRWR